VFVDFLGNLPFLPSKNDLLKLNKVPGFELPANFPPNFPKQAMLDKMSTKPKLTPFTIIP
jgi:hypothetical protein